MPRVRHDPTEADSESVNFTQNLQIPIPEDKQRNPGETIVTGSIKEGVKDMLEGTIEAEEE
ncbi:hypothetical protein [Haladaptatus halobius]|uniref:hypothetical protein n=1 Tax=Haladaptatus halobius TaxID=2884875 RepID=UPI001D09AD1C|nr:hypothetical protein [Haladaptatus halobius]